MEYDYFYCHKCRKKTKAVILLKNKTITGMDSEGHKVYKINKEVKHGKKK